MLTKSIFAPCKIYSPSISLPESKLITCFLSNSYASPLSIDLFINQTFFLAFSPQHAPNFDNTT